MASREFGKQVHAWLEERQTQPTLPHANSWSSGLSLISDLLHRGLSYLAGMDYATNSQITFLSLNHSQRYLSNYTVTSFTPIRSTFPLSRIAHRRHKRKIFKKNIIAPSTHENLELHSHQFPARLLMFQVLQFIGLIYTIEPLI